MNEPASATPTLATTDYLVMVVYLAFVVGLGFLFFVVLGYLCALLPGRIDPDKVNGLTLWTLKQRSSADPPPTSHLS